MSNSDELLTKYVHRGLDKRGWAVKKTALVFLVAVLQKSRNEISSYRSSLLHPIGSPNPSLLPMDRHL